MCPYGCCCCHNDGEAQSDRHSVCASFYRRCSAHIWPSDRPHRKCVPAFTRGGSCVCGGGEGGVHTHRLFGQIEPQVLCLINSALRSDSLLPLKLHNHIAPFSDFCQYSHANYSSEPANCIPPPLSSARCIRLFTLAHPWAIRTPHTRVNQHTRIHSINSFAGKLYNSLLLIQYSIQPTT